MKRISIKDIAKALNVNVSTVSRALNNHADLSQETKERVQQKAIEMGYVRNQMAIHFRNRHSGLIALIIPEMNSFFFPSVIRAIEEYTRLHGHNLIVLQSNQSLEKEKENVNICRDLGADGVLVSLCNETTNLNHFKTLKEQDIPFIFFDKVIFDDTIYSVTINDAAAAATATTHLLDLNHRTLAAVLGNKNLSITKDRLNGYQMALKKQGVEVNRNLICHASTIEKACAKVKKMLEEENPTALFVMSDELLVGTMQAVQQMGKALPEIICISDGFAPTLYTPPIHYVHHSGYEVGKVAAQSLFRLIDNLPVPIQHAQVEVKLVV